tara:strand:+ start:640 stop:846 length:207 start_codon:yes stop_codon:yes gene_type:complete
MANEVRIVTERIMRDGVAVLLQQVHYVNLKKIVTRELDAKTGIPMQIVKIMHILDLEEDDESPELACN